MLEPSCEGIGVVVNHETPETDYTLSMTASDSYDSCGPFDMYDLIKMLKGSGKMWRSTCKKTVPHTLVIEPTAECRGDDWTVQYLSFKLKGAKKVEIYVDEEKVFSVSYTATGPYCAKQTPYCYENSCRSTMYCMWRRGGNPISLSGKILCPYDG